MKTPARKRLCCDMFGKKPIKINAIDACLEKYNYAVLVISGSLGTGKTLLADTIAKSHDNFTRRYIYPHTMHTKYKYDEKMVEIFDDLSYADEQTIERLVAEPKHNHKLVRILCMQLHPQHEIVFDRLVKLGVPIIRCYTSSEVSFARDVLHGRFGDIVYDFHRKYGQALIDSMITRPCLVSFDGFSEILRFGVRKGWNVVRKEKIFA